MAQTTGQTTCDTRDVVLYVEDHPINVLLMQTVFELRPELRLVIAVDGASAMDMAAELQLFCCCSTCDCRIATAPSCWSACASCRAGSASPRSP